MKFLAVFAIMVAMVAFAAAAESAGDGGELVLRLILFLSESMRTPGMESCFLGNLMQYIAKE